MAPRICKAQVRGSSPRGGSCGPLARLSERPLPRPLRLRARPAGASPTHPRRCRGSPAALHFAPAFAAPPGGYRSGQTGQTVNLLANAYGGSNPSPPIPHFPPLPARARTPPKPLDFRSFRLRAVPRRKRPGACVLPDSLPLFLRSRELRRGRRALPQPARPPEARGSDAPVPPDPTH